MAFEDSPLAFSVMESDPVAHMVGVIAMENAETPVWFEITGNSCFALVGLVAYW